MTGIVEIVLFTSSGMTATLGSKRRLTEAIEYVAEHAARQILEDGLAFLVCLLLSLNAVRRKETAGIPQGKGP